MRAASDLRAVVRTAALAGIVGLPVLVLAISAVSVRWTFPQLLPDEPDLSVARAALTSTTGRLALAEGFAVSLTVTAASLALAWPAARGLVRLGGRNRLLAALALFLPSLLPAVGLAMGVSVGLFSLGLTPGFWVVVVAHLVVAVPYAVAMLAAALSRHDLRLERQAASLGAGPLVVWWRVTLPSVRAGVVAAAAFAFVVSWSQYLLTLLPGAGLVQTPTLALFSTASGGNQTLTATWALLVTVPVLVLLVVTAPMLTARQGMR